MAHLVGRAPVVVYSWGARLGRLRITWWDLWTDRLCFEIAWER